MKVKVRTTREAIPNMVFDAIISDFVETPLFTITLECRVCGEKVVERLIDIRKHHDDTGEEIGRAAMQLVLKDRHKLRAHEAFHRQHRTTGKPN